MKTMRSFLILFYVLDQCYSFCKEDDLGGFLGAISPELWEDGKPIDIAIYDEWEELNDISQLNEGNIKKAIFNFVQYYEKEFGLNFSETKKVLKKSIDDETLNRAMDYASKMYLKYEYVD